PVPEAQVALDALEQIRHAVLDPQAHARLDPLAHSAEHAGDRLSARARQQVDERKLEARARHRVSAEDREPLREVREAGQRRTQEGRREELTDDVQGGAHGLVAVERALAGDDLAPALQALALELHEDDEAGADPSEARLERLDEVEPQLPDLDRVDSE